MMIKQLFLASLLVLGTSSAWAQAAEKIRAAFDIGSTSTRLRVYKVDADLQKILSEEPLLSLDGKVPYEATMKDNLLTDETIQLGLATLQKFKQEAADLGVVEMAGVLTGPFRKADNAEEVLAHLQAETGLSLRIITQDEEAFLGYAAASSKAASRDLSVVDVGGSTLQFSTLREGKIEGLRSTKSTLAAVELAKSLDPQAEPNPISKDEFNEMVEEMQTWFANKDTDLAQEKKIVGIGNFFTKGMAPYGQKLSREGLWDLVGQRYEQFPNGPSLEDLQSLRPGDAFADQQMTNLALLLALFEEHQIETLDIVDVNLSEGVVLMNDYYRLRLR